MQNQIIIAPEISGAPAAPAINADGQHLKQELLVLASLTTKIPDTVHRDGAIETASKIKAHVTAIEKDRVAVKEPFLKMGRAIDEAAKVHVAELETELKRLNNLVGAFEQERRLTLQREEDARQAEVRRIEQERIRVEQEAAAATLNAQREADALAAKARLAAEAAAAKGRELSPAAKAKAMEAQLEAQEKQETAMREAAERAAAFARQQDELQKQQQEAADRARQEKASGIATRTEIDITVVNLHELYKAQPSCVKLTPDLVQIKWILNNRPDEKLPGITFVKRSVSSTRGSL